jgi:hypothetical protein
MVFGNRNVTIRSDPDRLARIFAATLEDHPPYCREELGPILRHQLSAAVEFDLGSLDPGSQRLLRAAAACGDQGGIRTFRDLFSHEHPPIQLLQLTKDFAKNHLNHPDSPLPPEIAVVLYYASIISGLVRLKRSLSWLTPADLARGLVQMLSLPWLDEELRRLFDQGLALLQPNLEL